MPESVALLADRRHAIATNTVTSPASLSASVPMLISISAILDQKKCLEAIPNLRTFNRFRKYPNLDVLCYVEYCCSESRISENVTFVILIFW